jgi:hypothetical protein
MPVNPVAKTVEQLDRHHRTAGWVASAAWVAAPLVLQNRDVALLVVYACGLLVLSALGVPCQFVKVKE